MNRPELADAVNAELDRANHDRRKIDHLYVDYRWIGKLERGETRWPHEKRRAALRHVLHATTDDDLGLYSPRITTQEPAENKPAALSTPSTSMPTLLIDGGRRAAVAPAQMSAVDGIHSDIESWPRVVIDEAGTTGGMLVSAQDDTQAENNVQRRTLIRALATLAGGPAIVGGPTLVSLEALRQGLGYALDADHDEWQDIATEYGITFYTTPAGVLIDQLGSDLVVLQQVIAVDDGAHAADLARAAARLSVVMAMSLVAVGQVHMARRFWRSAARAAEESRDAETRVLVAAWNAVGGCYDGRRPEDVIRVADACIARNSPAASAAAAGLHAARAQALAMARRKNEARDAVRTVATITEHLPATVSDDGASLWAWPEHRLRHTESYVHTYIGNVRAAEAAQDRALGLYPETHARLRTQVQLHRASCLIQSGHVGDGLRLAADLLDALPADQHNATLYEVGRQVLNVVPAGERSRSAAVEFAGRLP